MRVRDALLNDLPWIVDLYNSTIPGRMVTADIEPVAVESRMQWFQHHTTSKRPLWVAEEGGRAAWISFQDFYGRPAYDATAEVSIYVDERMRGKGLGSKILQHVLENSPSLKIKTLLGFVFEHNTPSLGLFKKFEFEKWGVLPDVAMLDGVERSLVILGKKLNG